MKGKRLLGFIPSLLALLALSTGVGTADAQQLGRVTALGFDAASKALLVVRAQELYRSDADDQGWDRVPLPSAVGKGRVAAVAAAAKRTGVWYLAGPGVGVLRTEDGGRTWQARNAGLPSREVVTLTTHAEQTDTVYVFIPEKGVFKSEDAGARWKLMDGGAREPIVQFVHSNMPGSMQTGWLFAATEKGVARSMDCFCGWRDAGGLEAKVYAVAYDPREPRQVYAATERGVFRSTNGGEQWDRLPSLNVDIKSMVVTPSGMLYAAGDGRLIRSRDGAKTWEDVGA